MSLDSQKALDHLRLYQDLEEAFAEPDAVVRLEVRDVQDAVALARVAELGRLKSLDICTSDVSRLLPLLGSLKQLQHLVLAACKVPSFPEAILGLVDLRYLNIGNCSLSHVPDGIAGLTRLEWLYISQNALQQVPATLGRLGSLQRLNLMYNRLEHIPDSIGDLVELDVLILQCNQLREIPSVVGSLEKLTYLNLALNELQTLPDSICRLRALESLDIHGNPFVSLPHCLSDMGATKITIEADRRLLFGDWTYQPSKKRARIALTELNLFLTPASDLYNPLMTAVRTAGLSEVGPQILKAARNAVEIETTAPDDYSRLGSSRLGGFPDLRSRSLFPKSDGLYWNFLAQFDLSDVAPFNNCLPRQGLLSFFIDSTEAMNAKVLYHPGAFDKLITVRHGGEEEVFDPQDDYTQKPHRVRFHPFFSLPDQPPAGIESANDLKAYEERLISGQSFDHHINGYTFTQHRSPQEEAADKLGGQSNEWVPLLQLGWDGKVGFCFCDAGSLTFSIHQEDLRRWDFSRIHLHLESS